MQESEEEGNPLRNPTESFIQVDWGTMKNN